MAWGAAALLLAVTSSALWAQGVQTGALTGTVKSNDGVPLADAVVTVKSPSLQGLRAVKTDALGAYILKGLPPGSYSIAYEHDSFAKAERTASLAVNLCGGTGFVKGSPAEKFYRDAKIGQIYEGTSNMQLQTIAREVLGR